MRNTLKTIKFICKIVIATLRVLVLVIVLALWILDFLPSGNPRSKCKIARALRSWALHGVKRSLPVSVARYVH
jgi:hypothetical protein